MKVLITGGAGFIGSHCADHLIGRGDEVTVLDDFSSGHERNISHHSGNDRFTLIQGDIRDADLCREAAGDMDAVIHLAAIASVEMSINEPETTYAVNVKGSDNMLRAAVAGRVKRFIFASSAAVYGDSPHLPLDEDLVDLGKAGPISPYGDHKLQVEKLCRKYFKDYGLETVAFRFFNVFGERQDPHSPYSGVISIFMDRIAKGKEVSIHGDGGQTRDFIYVGDVVRAIVDHGLLGKNTAGNIYNLGRSEEVSIRELFELIRSLHGSTVVPREVEPRPGDIRYSRSSTDRIRKETDWKAETGIRDGLRRMMDRPPQD
jgi:UDP-glucose 4-epimerase